METVYRKARTKREILKQSMSKSYCGETRFDYLDNDERPLIYNAMEEYAKQSTAQLQADKAELLEALEMIADGTAFCNTTGKIWGHWLTEMRKLIQKMKQ